MLGINSKVFVNFGLDSVEVGRRGIARGDETAGRHGASLGGKESVVVVHVVERMTRAAKARGRGGATGVTSIIAATGLDMHAGVGVPLGALVPGLTGRGCGRGKESRAVLTAQAKSLKPEGITYCVVAHLV